MENKAQIDWLLIQAQELREQAENELEQANEDFTKKIEIAEQIERTARVMTGEEESANSQQSTEIKETSFGYELAKQALAQITINGSVRTSSTGSCLKYVQDALEKVGVTFARKASAYMAIEAFTASDSFNKYFVLGSKITNEKQLESAPAGSVIIFDQCSDHKHGHIEIKANPEKYKTGWISDYLQTDRNSYAGNLPAAIYYPR